MTAGELYPALGPYNGYPRRLSPHLGTSVGVPPEAQARAEVNWTSVCFELGSGPHDCRRSCSASSHMEVD